VACLVQNLDGQVAQGIHVGRGPTQAWHVVVASVHPSLEESLDHRRRRVVVEALAPAMLGRAPANHQLDLHVVRHSLDVVASPGAQTTAVHGEDWSLLPPWTFFHACHCFARACHLKSARWAF